MGQSSLLGWGGSGRLSFEKCWPSGGRVLRPPGSRSSREVEDELDLLQERVWEGCDPPV